MTVKVAARVVTVTGKRGTIVREFKHLDLDVQHLKEAKKLRVDLWFGNRKQLACIRTICSHIENMITGVTIGFTYKMKFVYSHFPINVAVTNNMVEIRNFMGEKRVRKVVCLPGVEAVRTKDVKDQLELSGIDITQVSLAGTFVRNRIIVFKHLSSLSPLEALYLDALCSYKLPLSYRDSSLPCFSPIAAAQVQQATLIRKKDIRKFLDGQWFIIKYL